MDLYANPPGRLRGHKANVTTKRLISFAKTPTLSIKVTPPAPTSSVKYPLDASDIKTLLKNDRITSPPPPPQASAQPQLKPHDNIATTIMSVSRVDVHEKQVQVERRDDEEAENKNMNIVKHKKRLRSSSSSSTSSSSFLSSS